MVKLLKAFVSCETLHRSMVQAEDATQAVMHGLSWRYDYHQWHKPVGHQTI